MTAVVEFFFFLSVFMVFYVYVGYPLIVAFIGSILRRNVRKSALEPEVTVIISAHNEEYSIAQTLENKLCQDYPEKKLGNYCRIRWLDRQDRRASSEILYDRGCV